MHGLRSSLEKKWPLVLTSGRAYSTKSYLRELLAFPFRGIIDLLRYTVK